MILKSRKTARNTKNKPKTESNQQEYRVLELKVQNNSKSNKNKSKTHDTT